MPRACMLAAVLRKEVVEALREKHLRMVLGIGLVLPLFFGGLHVKTGAEAGSETRDSIGIAPAAAAPETLGQREVPKNVGPFAVAMSVGYGMLLAAIFAITLSLESFVGEKERRTLETLLSTPATDRELFLAKVLSCLLISVAMGVLFGAVGSAGLAVIAGLKGLPVPWALLAKTWACSLALLLATSLTCTSVGVILSSRVSTVKAGGQVFGLLMLAVVVICMVAGLLLEPHREAVKTALATIARMPLWALALPPLLGTLLLNWALLSLAARTFDRERILAGQ